MQRKVPDPTAASKRLVRGEQLLSAAPPVIISAPVLYATLACMVYKTEDLKEAVDLRPDQLWTMLKDVKPADLFKALRAVTNAPASAEDRELGQSTRRIRWELASVHTGVPCISGKVPPSADEIKLACTLLNGFKRTGGVILDRCVQYRVYPRALCCACSQSLRCTTVTLQLGACAWRGPAHTTA